MLKGARGVLLVGAEEMICSSRKGTVAGVTFSMRMKAGRSKRVVGSE